MKNNVVIFFTDQQRWDTMGLHHNPMNLTPNLDLMAQEGTHCYLAFTPQPVCLPARACLQSGLYPAQNGCNTNTDSLDFVQNLGLASYFNCAGYETAYIGKWHLNHSSSEIFTEPQGGYKYWLAENIPEFTSDAYCAALHDGEGKEHRLPGYRVDAYTDAAIRYIDQNREKPFFLMLSYLEPHFQNTRDDYPAPYGYEDRYQNCWFPPDLASLGGSSARHLPGYYGMVKRLDEAYGRLLDALRSLDLFENTVVLYTADHGCHFKTRNAEYKRSCHDSSLRIPMVWSGGPFQSGGRLQELISLIDVPPTLMEACNIDIPLQYQGKSILPLTRGNRNWENIIYAETSEDHISCIVRTQRWKYSVDWNEENLCWEEKFLYDLKADPYELFNLIGFDSHNQVHLVLCAKLKKKLEESGRGDFTIKPAPSVPAGQKIVTKEEAYL